MPPIILTVDPMGDEDTDKSEEHEASRGNEAILGAACLISHTTLQVMYLMASICLYTDHCFIFTTVITNEFSDHCHCDQFACPIQRQ
jgi:hypothetical protein